MRSPSIQHMIITELISSFCEALNTRTPYEAETRIRQHEGEYPYMNVRGIPVIDADGSVCLAIRNQSGFM
ncbi:hypothetical protein [Leptolyngbya sp. NM2-A1]|uniref:hypothetical protein n=1 Tax=Leptolyngbya sp. NM2-A1 TaxID=2933909 RepID=UPI0019842958|nr:hypothetical protein [Leptolyngbya sp. FACHB-16]